MIVKVHFNHLSYIQRRRRRMISRKRKTGAPLVKNVHYWRKKLEGKTCFYMDAIRRDHPYLSRCERRSLVEAIQNIPTIRSLDFTLTGYLFMEEAFKLIQNIPSLTNIDLGWCCFEGEELKKLCKILETNTTLKWLDLSDNCICGDDCFTLSELFQKNNTLEWINLDSSYFSLEDCQVLCNGLKNNTSLKTVGVGYCFNSDEDHKPLVDLLQNHNTTICNLGLYCPNTYNEPNKDQLQVLLARNKTKRAIKILFDKSLYPSNALIHGPYFERHYLFDLNVMIIVGKYM